MINVYICKELEFNENFEQWSVICTENIASTLSLLLITKAFRIFQILFVRQPEIMYVQYLEHMTDADYRATPCTIIA